MFEIIRPMRKLIFGLLSIGLFVSVVPQTPRTITSFQATDNHRVLDHMVQTNSPTVTRKEYVPRGIPAAPEVTVQKFVPRPQIAPPASRSRRSETSLSSLYSSPHQIYHTANCPAAPQWVTDLAQQIVTKRFGESQWIYAQKLWTKESNFNPWCENSSGAYGIPQALPGSKMGGNWRYDVAHQIEWGVEYIAGRYNNPLGAWEHSQTNNWY